MRIIINNSSMQPIYEQIAGQVKSLVQDGSLVEGAPLPSVRSLSKELRISALTVKKAYDALEQEGYVITVHGKGSYITKTNINILQEEQHKEVENKFEEAIREGRLCGLKDSEIREIFELILEDGL